MKHATGHYKQQFDEWQACGEKLDLALEPLYEQLGATDLMKLLCQRMYSLAAEQSSTIPLDDVQKIQEKVGDLHDEICETELEKIE